MKPEACLLSIIVPVYQAERYLHACVDSLLQQGDDTEIWLVDDGSTDASGAICDAYAEAHGNVSVIHKPNGGHVSARMAGIVRARGRYLVFCDSDDWVDGDYYRDLALVMEKDDSIDIAIGRMVREYADGHREEIGEVVEPFVMTPREAVIEMFSFRHFRWEQCGKVYRRRLFDDFLPDASIVEAEDLDENWILFQRAQNVAYLPRPQAYHYRYNLESITNNARFTGENTYRVWEKILANFWVDDDGVRTIAVRGLLSCLQVNFREYAFRSLWAEGEMSRDAKKAAAAYRKLHEMVCASPEEDGIQRAWDRMQPFTGSYEDCLALHRARFSAMADALRDCSARGGMFYVYGTGVVARYAARTLEHLQGGCTAYLVSEGELCRPQFFGKPVLVATEETLRQAQTIFLAMARKGQEAVCGRLSEWCRGKVVRPDLDGTF